MAQSFDLTDHLPDVVARKLKEALFTTPSSIALFGVGLSLAAPFFWGRTHDFWLLGFGLIGILLVISRIVIFWYFRNHATKQNAARHLVLVNMIGCMLSLSLASLSIRAVYLGEIVSIELAVIAIAAYIVGIVGRGAAILVLAIPHLVLLFIPLISAALIANDRAYLFIALVLTYFCFAGVRVVLDLHKRTKAQIVAEHKLAVLARTDYLTGLSNRAWFDAHGTELLEVARSRSDAFVVGMIDLDGFKAVNDTQGHAAGDELLREVANRLTTVLDGDHFIARLGGDEFAIVFDIGTTLDDAKTFCSKITAQLEQPFCIGDKRLQISGSVGISDAHAGDIFARIVERADEALYCAKKAGRNQSYALTTQERWVANPHRERESASMVDDGMVKQSTVRHGLTEKEIAL